MRMMEKENQPKRIGNLVAPATIDYVWAITSDEVMDEDLLFRIVEYPFENRERKQIGIVLGQIEKVFTQNEFMNPWDRRGRAHVSFIAKYGELPHVRESMDKKVMKIRNLLYYDGKTIYSSLKNSPNTGVDIHFADTKTLNLFYPWNFPKTGAIGYAKGSNYPFPLDLSLLCFMNTLIIAGIGHGKTHTAALLAALLHIAKKKVLVIDPTGQWAMAANSELKEKPLQIDLSIFKPAVFYGEKFKPDIEDILDFYLPKTIDWQSIFPTTSSDKRETIKTNVYNILSDFLSKKGGIDFKDFGEILIAAASAKVPLNLAELGISALGPIWKEQENTERNLRLALKNLNRYRNDFDMNIKDKLANVITLEDVIKEFESGKLTIIDLSGIPDDDEKCLIAKKIEDYVFNKALEEYKQTHKEYVYDACIFVEEAHRFLPESPEGDQQKECQRIFIRGAREGRKYGLGHVFIDQRFVGLSKEAMQTQTYILGRLTTPGDISALESVVGKDIALAVQRTIPKRTFIVTGVASPLSSQPCEIEVFSDIEEVINNLKEFGGYEEES
jgi:cellulose biosynthesis protein BcsQ